MIILKIFPPAASFNGVTYNTDKILRNDGELMALRGFDLLEGFDRTMPSDYINYFKMIALSNRKIQKPQFHGILSAKGKSAEKTYLADLAGAWLNEMGYGRLPYLVVFHKDTQNCHVHMVSIRVSRQGKAVPSSFERIRGHEKLNQLLGLDENLMAQNAIRETLIRGPGSREEFYHMLKKQRYLLTRSAEFIDLIRFGKRQAKVELSEIDRALRPGYYPEEQLQRPRGIKR